MLGICLTLIDEPSDKEKFEHLYYTYKEMMSKLAMSIMHNEDLVKETVQDCFLQIAEMIAEIPVVESRRTKALIVIMVKNKARDNLEAEHYDKVERLDNSDCISDKIVNEIMTDLGYRKLIQELKGLDSTYRDILLLKIVYEFSANEISELLHIPPRTVDTRIYRGRKILKEKLEGYFDECSGEK